MRHSFAAPFWMRQASCPPPKKSSSSSRTNLPTSARKLIDKLLERDEYVDYWAYKWSDLLLVSSRKLRPTATRAFYNWIRDSVRENKPWDQFARDIFTSAGSTRQNGALNYYVLHKDPIELTENVTQAFLGQRLTCARCHNHPLEKWTQKQYFQMANLFSRVGVKNGDDASESIIYAKTSGDINHPRLLRPLPPTPLDGEAMPLDSEADRRIHFAKWLTSPKNEMFARNIVNRVWGTVMGKGLADPIDDVRATNPASNEELFAAVTKDFIEHGYDIKRLIRTIMNFGYLSAFRRSERHKQGRQSLLLEVRDPATARRSIARRDIAGARRAQRLCRLSRGYSRAAIA